MTLSTECRLNLQEREYLLPYHWILTRNSEARYRALSQFLAQLILADGLCVQETLILDIGCGDACGASQLKQLLPSEYRVWGIDVSHRALRFADIMAPEIKVAQSTAQHLPFPQCCFEIVCLREVIEHIPNALEMSVLHEAARVLKPGGRLVLTTSSICVELSSKHFRHYSKEMIRDRFRRLGLVSHQIYGFAPRLPMPLELAYRLLRVLPHVWRWFVWRWRPTDLERAKTLVAVAKKPEGA